MKFDSWFEYAKIEMFKEATMPKCVQHAFLRAMGSQGSILHAKLR